MNIFLCELGVADWNAFVENEYECYLKLVARGQDMVAFGYTRP